MSGKARNHCFTLNNYTLEEEAAIHSWECSYMVIGREIAPDTGTPHLQGYVEWKNPRALSALKKLNPRIHWEVRKGTAVQASEYCKKGGAIWMTGEISSQGKRSDLQEVGRMALAGDNLKTIACSYPTTFVKFHKGIEKLVALQMEDRSEPPIVTWIWGLAGRGKTRYCRDQADTSYIKDGTQWWDGYEQQDAIIIDDFDGKWPLRDLLRLLDRYPYQGQYKGGYVKINSRHIFITCELPPWRIWQDNELAQVVRRLSDIIEMTGDGITPQMASTIAAQRMACGMNADGSVAMHQ